MKKARHIYSILLVIVFLIITFFVMVNDLLHFSVPPSVLVMEKRNLAKKPVFNVGLLDPYPPAYDRFYNDRFPFRLELTKFYAGIISLKFFHRSPYPEMVNLGQNGWMYFNMERKYYEGTYKLTDYQVKKIASEIHNRAEYYYKKGIKFYLAIPPLKDEIYPEYLPLNYYRQPGKNGLEKAMDLIAQDTLVNFINLKPALLEAKKYGRLYYKTDNHWNALGGYWGYRAVIERMQKDFPSIKPLDTSDFTMVKTISKGKNLTEVMNLKDFVQDEELTPKMKVERVKEGKKRGYKPRPNFGYPLEFEIVKQINNPGLPIVVIVRDSYFYGMMPFIIQNFRKTVILYDTGTYGVFDDAIRIEQPNLVLYMIYEPHLMNLIGIYK